MWTIAIDGVPGSFNPFPTRKEAKTVATSYAKDWPNHTYRVVKDQDFAPRPPMRRRRLKA